MLMLRKELRNHFKTEFFKKQRKEIEDKAFKKLSAIKAGFGAKSMNNINSDIARNGLFPTMTELRQLVHKLGELRGGKVDYEYPVVMRYGEAVRNNDNTPKLKPEYAPKKYLQLARMLETARNRGVSQYKIKEIIKRVEAAVSSFVKAFETYSMAREEKSGDNRYDVHIDNYISLDKLGKSQGGLIGPVLTIENQRVKRCLNGYAYDSLEDNTKLYSIRYDEESIAAQKAFVAKHNPKGVAIFQEVLDSVLGIKKTKAE